VFFDEKDYTFYLQQLKISVEQSGVLCIDDQSCAFEMADPDMDKANIFREAMKTFVCVHETKGSDILIDNGK
jgi:hypothetical protein